MLNAVDRLRQARELSGTERGNAPVWRRRVIYPFQVGQIANRLSILPEEVDSLAFGELGSSV